MELRTSRLTAELFTWPAGAFAQRPIEPGPPSPITVTCRAVTVPPATLLFAVTPARWPPEPDIRSTTSSMLPDEMASADAPAEMLQRQDRAVSHPSTT